MSDDLDDLARMAADALVSAMATDSWEAVKRRFAALVGHERRMDAARTELAARNGADRDRAELSQTRVWTTRLRDVLDDDPAAAEGLRTLIADLRGIAPLPAAPASQFAQADYESQAVNVGGSVGGNTGEVYVGVGTVDKRKANIALAPFTVISGAAKTAAGAHPLAATAAIAVVLLGAGTVTGWRTHWPPAIFGTVAPATRTAVLPEATTVPPEPRSSPPPSPSPADSNPAGTLSDGSKVELADMGSGPGNLDILLKVTAGLGTTLTLGSPGILDIQPVDSNGDDQWTSSGSTRQFSYWTSPPPESQPDVLEPGQSVCVDETLYTSNSQASLSDVSAVNVTVTLGNGTTEKLSLPPGGGADSVCGITSG